MAAAKRLPRCVHTREPKGRICQHRRNHPSHRRSNRTSRAFQGQLLQATHSLRAAPTPLTTSAAAPRGPSLWSARPGAARPGSPGRSARSSAATERSRVGAGLGTRGGGGRPGPTFLLAPSGKALAGSAIWSCSFSASASLREAL